mgnify:CR=1 FL=1
MIRGSVLQVSLRFFQMASLTMFLLSFPRYIKTVFECDKTLIVEQAGHQLFVNITIFLAQVSVLPQNAFTLKT